MASELEARELPDGMIELTLGRCVPVVLSLETYAAHTHRELFRLVGMLTLIAHYFTEEHGYLLPMQTGQFVEDLKEERFVLAPSGPVGVFCKLSVPRECAFE